VSPTAKSVLKELADRADENGTCWCTIERLGSSLFHVGRNGSGWQREVELAGEQIDDGLEVAG
jgi:hypothetical protein